MNTGSGLAGLSQRWAQKSIVPWKYQEAAAREESTNTGIEGKFTAGKHMVWPQPQHRILCLQVWFDFLVLCPH